MSLSLVLYHDPLGWSGGGLLDMDTRYIGEAFNGAEVLRYRDTLVVTIAPTSQHRSSLSIWLAIYRRTHPISIHTLDTRFEAPSQQQKLGDGPGHC